MEERLGGGRGVGINPGTHSFQKNDYFLENTKQSTGITQALPRRGNINSPVFKKPF